MTTGTQKSTWGGRPGWQEASVVTVKSSVGERGRAWQHAARSSCYLPSEGGAARMAGRIRLAEAAGGQRTDGLALPVVGVQDHIASVQWVTWGLH